MRVLAIGNLYPPAAAGGYERIWVAVMRALVARGHEVRVLTTAPVPGRPVEGPDPAGPPVFRELRWYWRDFDFPSWSRSERRSIEKENAAVVGRHLSWKPDVVSWWGMGGMSLSLLDLVRAAGVPSVGVVGDTWMDYGPKVAPSRGVDVAGAARWLFISEYLRGHFPVPRSGLAHPGVDPQEFPFNEPGRWRWRLACIGRVEQRKGVGVAVQALTELPDEAVLVVDGPGEAGHVEELGALASHLGVGVEFRESAPDGVFASYAEADVVLFPVVWDEPWGLVPLEAMSVGRPVVATGTGGSGEYLREGVNALVVPPYDPVALAEAVRRIAADRTLRASLIAGGRETAARFSAAGFEEAVVSALEDEAATQP